MQEIISFIVGLILSGVALVTGGTQVQYDPVPTPAPSAAVTALSTTTASEKKVIAATPPKKEPVEMPALPETPVSTGAEGMRAAIAEEASSIPEEKIVKQAPEPPPPVIDEEFLDQLAEEVIKQTNKERQKNDLPDLVLDRTLEPIALMHSKDMLEKDYFAHENKEGCNSVCRINNAGYKYRAVGENLFMMRGFALDEKDAAALIVQGWMGSAGHRANILKDKYTHTAVAVAAGNKKIYITALYSLPR